MTRHRLEVADVFREHADEYLGKYGGTSAQRRVLRDIQNCRTAVLGGHVEACDHCGHQRIAYNSCRNRHCPKCQGPARARWLEAGRRVVAGAVLSPGLHAAGGTRPLALQNPRLLYGLLFQAASRDPAGSGSQSRAAGRPDRHAGGAAHLGPEPAASSARACVIPAGGIAPDGSRLDGVPAGLLPAGARAQPRLSGQVPGGAEAGSPAEDWRSS